MKWTQDHLCAETDLSPDLNTPYPPVECRLLEFQFQHSPDTSK